MKDDDKTQADYDRETVAKLKQLSNDDLLVLSAFVVQEIRRRSLKLSQQQLRQAHDGGTRLSLEDEADEHFRAVFGNNDQR